MGVIDGMRKLAEAAQEVDVAEIDRGRARRTRTTRRMTTSTTDRARAVQRFGDGREIEMIVAPRRDRRAR